MVSSARQHTYRLFTDENRAGLWSAFLENNWEPILNCADLKEATDKLLSELDRLYNIHCPLPSRVVRHRGKSRVKTPWLTDRLLRELTCKLPERTCKLPER